MRQLLKSLRDTVLAQTFPTTELEIVRNPLADCIELALIVVGCAAHDCNNNPNSLLHEASEPARKSSI
jgi:hypothetical protein